MLRFQKITAVYPEFESAFRKQYPAHDSLSYEEIYQRLIAASYAWSDYFARYLGQLGYQAAEFFANFELLQKAWARENGVRFTRRNWVNELALAQIKSFQPDILFLEDLYVSDADFRARAREACKHPIKIIGWRAAPTDDYLIFRDLDLVLTCAPVFIDELRRHGVETELMSHAFEPSILDRVGPTVRDLDFTFIGLISLSSGFHRQRYSYVAGLMEATTLEMWGDIVPPAKNNKNLTSRLSAGATRIIDRLAPIVGERQTSKRAPTDSLRTRFPNRFHESVFGLDNFRLLGRSRLTFNCHIDSAETSAGNARLFEATGMGTCLVTDSKKNLPQLFAPDTEVVTYKSIEECIEKVDYLQEHESERQQIAAAGQSRTLRDHTYKRRAEQLDEIIRMLVDDRIGRNRSYAMPA